MLRIFYLCTGIIFIFVLNLQASIIRVPSQYPLIQDAINAASIGDTVLISPGTYSGSGNRNLSIGKAIHIGGDGQRDEIILDAEGQADGFVMNLSGEDTNTVIENITISNARQGIFLNGTSPKLISLKISSCTVLGIGHQLAEGGEIAPLVRDCEFIDNSVGLSACANSNILARNCIFQGDSAAVSSDNSTIELKLCTFRNNTIGIHSYINLDWNGCSIDSSTFENNSTSVLGSCSITSSSIFGGGDGVRFELSDQACLADNVVFENISNVFTTSNLGPSILLEVNTAPGFSISNSIIRNCGQIANVVSPYEDAGQLLMLNTCVISGNTGGIIVNGPDSKFAMVHCVYTGNGGPIDYSQSSIGRFMIDRSTLANNQGDAISISTTTNSVIITSTIITNNGGAGIRFDIDLNGDTVKFSDVVGNSGGNYVGIPDQNGNRGNISSDPLFVGGDPFDYHLQSGSPCIDTGDPLSPLDPDSTRADMGAFYFEINSISNFDLVSPESASVNLSAVPLFIWHAAHSSDSQSVMHYRIYIDTLLGFGSCDSSALMTDTTFSFPESLGRGYEYYWQVRAVSTNGQSRLANSIGEFFLPAYPEPFAIYLPSDEMRQVVYYTRFAWGNTRDINLDQAVSFGLEYSADSLFNDPIVTLAGLADTAIALVTDSIQSMAFNIFWRVFAVNRYGLAILGGEPGDQIRVLHILPAGDANSSRTINGLDVIFMVNYLKGMGPAPDPLFAADANGNCMVNGLDVIYLVNYLKGLGPNPARGLCD